MFLLLNYLLRKKLDYTPIVCTTIVSSSMLKSVAETAGAVFCETLTGFKWLANTALNLEDKNHRFLFAYEEALGYAAGRQVRDKDGLSALLAFAQMTAALSREGKSVLDQLESLYRRHGIFLTGQRSIALQKNAPPIGDLLRASPPEAIAGSRVIQLDDLDAATRQFADGRIEALEFPRSDVLIYRLENRARVIVRPSGTEPKVKCYYEVVEATGGEPYDVTMQRAKRSISMLIHQHQGSLAALLC